MANGFWEMVRFELRLRARNLTSYIFWLILFALCVAITSADTGVRVSREGGEYANASTTLSLVGVIVVAMFATMASFISGIGIYRDFESNSHELFFTTRLNKAGYWFGRFTGAFIVTLLVFSAIPLGFFLGTVAPWTHKEILGPFRADTYIALCLHFLLPDLFLISVIFFVGGALTRSLLAIYTQGIVLLVAWLGSAALTSKLKDRAFASLFEPFGVAALGTITRYWTVYERNNYVVPLSGTLLQNRLIWTGIAVVILVGGYFIFDFAHAPRTLRRRRLSEVPPAPATAYTAQDSKYLAAGWQYHIHTFVRLFRYYLSEILRGVPFITITISGVLLLLIVASQADEAYGTPVYPVTRVVLESITDTFTFFFLALIMFYTGELVWRERMLRADQITDTLPTSSATILAAKVGAVLGMVGVLNLALIVAGILLQLGKGFTHIELPLYFTWLFGVDFWDYAAVVFLAFFLHIVINHKFLAHASVVVLLVVAATLQSWGYTRNILYYSSSPDYVYSDMNGFGPFLPAVRWHQFYWIACGILLLILALKLMVRGTDNRWKARWSGSKLGIGGKTAAVLAGASFVAAGTFILYNTDVLNEYTTEITNNKRAARYEKDYKKRYEKTPQPRVTAVNLDIALYPERGQFTMRGTYKLRNKTKKPIREIVVDYNKNLTIKRFVWSLSNRPGITDKQLGFMTFVLEKPLAPGAELTLDFDMADERRGFKNEGAATSVVSNGTFLTMPAPTIGYNDESELTDPEERRKRGLPERRVMPPVTDKEARMVTYVGKDADWIQFDATVRTAPDQTAFAPGYLVKEWNENGQHCFQYHMDAPIRNFYSILSARYKVKTDSWTAPDGKKVALAVYYDPAHPYNLERMLTGVKESLRYCSENFSPYQFRQLRIMEFPNYAAFAQSFPNTVPFSEGIGFIARVDDNDKNLDYPLFVSAHETAHQWWAHQVLGANVEGSEMLAESLAEYSALMVVNRKYGKEYVRRFLRYDLDAYLKGRGSDSSGENPLVRAQHQQYIHYNKGALAFYALAERIGEKRLNAILARFVKDKKFQKPPYTTAEELVAYMKQGATREEQAYIHDLFERITIYDCHAEKATRKKQKNGKWAVTLTFSTSKFYAESDGKETPAAFRGEVVDIGVFAKPKGDQRSSEERLGKLLIKPSTVTLETRASGKRTTTMTSRDVPGDPQQAGIDPYNVMIDRTPNNNVVDIEGVQ